MVVLEFEGFDSNMPDVNFLWSLFAALLDTTGHQGSLASSFFLHLLQFLLFLPRKEIKIQLYQKSFIEKNALFTNCCR